MLRLLWCLKKAFRSKRGLPLFKEFSSAETLPSLTHEYLVAEWIHFTLFGIILPTIKLKVYIFWGL